LGGVLRVRGDSFQVIEPVESPDWPRLGSYTIGGDRRFDQDPYIDAAALRKVNIQAIWPGWEVGKTRTMAQSTLEVQNRSEIGSEVYQYIIYESTMKINNTVGQPLYALWAEMQANKWWAWSNGLTETGQIDSYETSFFQINHSTAGKVVSGKRAYQWIIDYYLDWLVRGVSVSNGSIMLPNTANPYLNGLFFDNFFPEFDTTGSADFDRNGSVDSYSSAGSRALCQGSNAAAADYYRSVYPDKLLLGNSARYSTVSDISLLSNKLNGGVIEGGIGQSYSYETHTSFQAYRNDIQRQMDNYAAPKYGVVVNVLDNVNNSALRKYALCACMLTDAYHYAATSGLRSQDLAIGIPEYTINLGQRTQPAPTSPTHFAEAGGTGGGVYRIEFENGIALCGARRGSGALTSTDQTTPWGTVNLGGTFYTSAGVAVTQRTVTPRFGEILYRQDPT
jgi:hypothetical protein